MYLTLILALALSSFVIAWGLTGIVRRYALARAILDMPNERSLHSRPIPRGGGLAIAVVVLAVILVGWIVGVVPGPLAAAAGGGGAMIAAVGWVDDLVDLSPLFRATIQFAAAVGAVIVLGGLPYVEAGVSQVDLGVAGSLLAAVGIVWLTNLYNFMDGIDGLAAGEAATVGLAATAMLVVLGDWGAVWVVVGLAGSAAGFLVWNWSPARVFMGDVSSGMLGFLFAVLALHGENRGTLPILAWALLLGVFLFDATVTLVRRLIAGEKWYAPHRLHAYQRAVQAGYSHATVTSVILAMNCLLATVAYFALLHSRYLVVALGAVVTLLGAAYFWVERRCPAVFARETPPATAPDEGEAV